MAMKFHHIFHAKAHRDAASLDHDGQEVVSFECIDEETVEVWFKDGDCLLVDMNEVETAIVITAND